MPDDNVTPIRPDDIEPEEEGVFLTPQWMWTPNDVTQILVTVAVLMLVVSLGFVFIIALANQIT